jgi:hypothetical protein
MSTLQWECRALASAPAGAVPRCQIESKRAFRLGKDFLPRENLIAPATIQIGVGLSDALPLTDR